MSSITRTLVFLSLVALSPVSQSDAAQELLYDFETEDQHRELNLDTNPTTPPGWGSFGTITLDRGPNSDASAGDLARFHAGDFDLPADLPGNFGLINVSDRFNPNRKDFSGYTGLALDMKFESNEDLPYSGPLDVEIGLGFIVPGLGEDESLQVYAPPITLTDTYDTYEMSFNDLAFVQSGSTLQNDLANNAFIKIRFTNTLESEGRGNLYYDEIYGITGGATPLPGDANSDGSVDLLDLDILGSNFGSTPATFAQGDFNEDGTVDLLDLDILGSNFGAGTSTTIPEPLSLGMVAALLVLSTAATSRSRS